ncbi:MAG: NAD(P)-dependent oxidoreductase [Variibacter sp.]|nr:NAD(P)-dependent oxidoreductase [Variibacter sp.]
MEIGFIGLGNMGLPMARRLLEAGHTVVACDTRPEAVAKAVALGATSAASPAELADRVETIVASLPTPDIVKAVATGPGGVIQGKRVRRFVDLSTTGSTVAREIAQALAARNIVQIDCPVSGGVLGAEKGTLAVMVSGPRADVAVVEAALAVFGKVFFIGETPGLAQSMKLVNNLLSAACMAMSSEAMVLAAKAGIDPATAVEVVNNGSGRNSATQDKFPRAILPGTFNLGFTNALMTKDVRLALAEAQALGLTMDVGQAVGRAWERAMTEVGPQADFTTVIQPLEKAAKVEVRGPKTEPARAKAAGS